MDSSFINKPDTGNYIIHQYSTLTLRKYNIQNKSNKVFYKLYNVKPGPLNGRFSKDEIDQTYFRTGSFDFYILDTVNDKLSPSLFYELGNGFSLQNKADKEGRKLMYNGKLISQRTGYSLCKTGKGIISDYPNDKQVSVWSAATSKWIFLKIPWIEAVIGWIDE